MSILARPHPSLSDALALVAGALVCGGALLGVAPARADDLSVELPVFGPTTFSMTSTTTLRYRGSNYDNNPFDDDFGSLQQRFDLALQGDELRLEVRLDAFVPFAFDGDVGAGFRTWTPPGGMPTAVSGWFGSAQSGCAAGREEQCYLAWDARPERMVLRWDHESWSVELGDAQLVIGRGIALSFRKVDLLGVDNALRGAHVRFDDGHFRFRLHTGLANPQNQDPITLGILRDPADVVAAATMGATFGPGDMFQVSGHAVRVWFEEEGRDFFQQTGELTYDRSVDVLGWTAEAPSLADGHLSLYVEANGMRRASRAPAAGEAIGAERFEFGRAVYASAQLLADNLTVLVEWKDYQNFLVAAETTEGSPWRIYSAAPSLEFDGPQRLRAIGNQRGGSVRIDYAFLPGPWQFSLNGSFYGLNEEPLRDPWNGILVTHGWATIQRRQEYGEDVTWSVNASAGFRQETLLHDVPAPTPDFARHAGDVDRRTIHGMIEGTIGAGEHSFDINVDHRFEQEFPFDRLRDFQVGGVSVTYTYNIQLAVSLALRWTDFKPGENRARDQRDYNFMGGELYPSIEARWNFDPGTFLRAFVGTTPGGQVCSGGVCREVPPYEGVLFQFVGRL